MEHRGERILRVDYSSVAPADLVVAADQVRRIVTREPMRSVRTLTILHLPATAEAVSVLKECARANTPHVRASAVVGSNFWTLILSDPQMRGREDLQLFDDEASALDWLASQ